MLGGLLAGSAAVWAVTSGPVAGLVDSRKAIEKQPIEKIIPIGTSEFSQLPEAGYYTVPFFFGPNTQEEFNECVCPPAACNKQYSFDSGEKAIKANYTPSGTYCDYWAFLPGVKMTPGIYRFSVEYKTKNNAENFAIFLCESQDVNAEHTPLLVFES